jgi:hypothetical protein
MDWKTLKQDLKLYNDLLNRFIEVGCTETEAYSLATYAYSTNKIIVLRSKNLKNSNQNKKRY